MRVPYKEMYDEFVRVLLKKGFTQEKAEISAKLYADASRDGVYTHGLNRFPQVYQEHRGRHCGHQRRAGSEGELRRV